MGFQIKNKYIGIFYIILLLIIIDNEIRLYFQTHFETVFAFQFVYGFDRKYYPENLKAEEFNINYDYVDIVTSEESKYFKLPKKYSFYKCKNKEVIFSIGYSFNNSFYNVVDTSQYFDFSNYNYYDILEIEANEDFLLLDGENDGRSNNKIKVIADNKLTDEIESEYIYIEFKEPIFYREKRYVFAPKTDYYMEMIQNECFLYKIFHYKNNDSNIIILDFPDLSQVLKKNIKNILQQLIYHMKIDIDIIHIIKYIIFIIQQL